MTALEIKRKIIKRNKLTKEISRDFLDWRCECSSYMPDTITIAYCDHERNKQTIGLFSEGPGVCYLDNCPKLKGKP